MTVANPTYPGRMGLMYEEVWALLLCAEWMRSPASYSDIRFQTAPEEAGSDKFFLDDVVLKKVDGSYELYQVKHKIHPSTDEWRWTDFTSPRSGNKQSEFAKWADSLNRAVKGGAKCSGYFITNGSAHSEVGKYLTNGNINYEEIKAKDQELRTQVEGAIGEAQCSRFFKSFELRFGQKSLHDLEKDARTILYKDLGATESGVNSLILELRRQFAAKMPAPITLGELRAWCEFDVPRPLNQEFDVPGDFQWFDEGVHKSLLANLEDVSGGVQVVIGKPGCGKSTYLSKLAKELQSVGKVCIRHHYHISPSDPDPLDRLSLSRSEEALKAQFKEHEAILGDLQHKNSATISLEEFVGTAAAHGQRAGVPIVLIVDGLDHAMRNEAAEDLEALLKQVCRPQPGLWIVLGMQEVAAAHLPNSVLTSCPKADWIEIAGLNDAGVDAIVRANQIQLNLPDDESHLAPLLSKVRSVTQGNPLHLRYTLTQLKLSQGDAQVSEYGLGDIIPYKTEIHDYYTTLWISIPDAAKSFVLAVQILETPLQEEQFFDLAASLASSPSEVSASYRQIAHLVSRDRDGIHLFHASLAQFLLTTEDFSAQRTALLHRIENWLAASEHEELKWALLKVLHHMLGHSEALLGLDRDWLVDAVARGRSEKTIERQLNLAHDEAFDRKDYPSVVKFANLLNYFLGNTDYHSDITERLWIASRIYYQTNPLTTRIATLSHGRILAILAAAKTTNQVEEVIDECIDELNRSHRYYDFRAKGEWSSTPPDIAEATITAISGDSRHEVNHVIEYCRQFEDLGWNLDLLGHYARELCKDGISEETILRALDDLDGDELLHFCDGLASACIRHSHKNLADVIGEVSQLSSSECICIYLALCDKVLPSELSLPEYHRFPDEVDEFDSKGRPERVRLIRGAFVTALALGFSDRSKEVVDWISGAPATWPTEMVSALLRAALEIVRDVRDSQKVSLSPIVKHIQSVPKLNWPEDRPRIEWQMSLPDTLEEILEVMVALGRWYGQKLEVKPAELLSELPTPYFGKYHLLRSVTRMRTALFSDADYENFIEPELQEYCRAKDEFPERARHYLSLFDLCMIHGDRDRAGRCLYQAANNLLGYGSHKDPFIWYLLDCIESCHLAGSHKTLAWLKRIAPMITNIREITDGDDVHGFRSELAELLNKVNPPTLRSWYRHSAELELFGLAEELFPKVLESLDLATPIDQAIAATGIDQASLTALRRLAVSDEGANAALQDIEHDLGKAVFQEKRDEAGSGLKKLTEEDVAHIEPSDVKNYLQNQVDSWNRSYFYKPWAATWLSADNPRRREAYNALMEMVDQGNIAATPAELLDAVFPILFEDDRERAFDYLCWAQANDRGWAYNYTDESNTEHRWKIISERYRSRYRDFFELSVKRTDDRRGRESRFFPVPRGVDYFCRFEDLSNAEAVTEVLIKTLEGSKADLLLPEEPWLQDDEPSSSELLFLRLYWPGSHVRERAASVIASLIRDECAQSSVRQRAFSYLAVKCRRLSRKFLGGESFHSWMLEKGTVQCEVLHRLLICIRGEEVESRIVLCLLPLVKALEYPVWNSRNVSTILCGLVSTSSPVIDAILSEICGESSSDPFQLGYNEARVPSDSYELDRFFNRDMTLFFDPYYVHEAARIDSKSRISFTKTWSHEADRLMEEIGVERVAGEAPEFVGGRMTPVVSGFSSRVSEVYRSAFVRTLNYFSSIDAIDEDSYLEAAYKTMPVDLSYWKMVPERPPDWWPTVTTIIADDARYDAVIGVEFDAELDRICQGVDGQVILGMTGPAKHTNSAESHKHNVNITIVGFAYDLLGSSIPSADAVSKQLYFKPSKLLRPSTATRPLNFLECMEEHVQFPQGYLSIEDLKCEPLVARASDLTINLWQSYRGFPTFVLSDSLSRDLKLLLDQGKCFYLEGSTEAVASIHDWKNGITERHSSGDDQPFGTWIQCDRNFLERRLEQLGMRLGFLCSIKHSYRKYDYEQPVEYVENRLMNVSRIIT